MPTENFLSASNKHYNDATSLQGLQRHDNTAYLSGYVVECALKSMIEASGTFNPRSLGHDLAALSTTAVSLAAILSSARQNIAIPSSPDFQNLIHAWNPAERYHPEGVTLATTAVSRLQAAREAVEAIVVPLILNGTSNSSTHSAQP